MINENDPSTLSTSGRLLSYNSAVKEGLQTGLKFTELMDKLISTKDADVLVSSAQELSTFVLDTDYVTFPHQYNTPDYYLIFMSRLLELHGKDNVITLQSHEDQHLTQQIASLEDKGVFSFTIANDGTGGVYYQEQVTGETIFYLNLQRKMLRINSAAITKLFVITYHEQVASDQILETTQLFMDFGSSLKEDYGFSVDFNILDTSNNEFYAFTNSNLSDEVVDKLFVAAAKEDYMLMHSSDGAVLELPNQVTLHITSKNAKWGMTVHDDEEATSWFKLLLDYPFVREWYLENLSDLEVKSDPLVFG